MLEADIEVQVEAHQVTGRCTSMQGRQHTECQRHYIGFDFEGQTQSQHDGQTTCVDSLCQKATDIFHEHNYI
jgi:hypothetical protein